MNKVALFVLVATAFGGILWVCVYPMLSGERRAAQRQKVIATANPTVRTINARTQQKARREQIEGSLKELDARKSKNKAPSLSQRIAQAGFSGLSAMINGTAPADAPPPAAAPELRGPAVASAEQNSPASDAFNVSSLSYSAR